MFVSGGLDGSMRRTCVGKAGRTKYAAQNLEYLDQIPRGTKSIFLASSMGVDSWFHFENKFGLRVLQFVCDTARCLALP